MAQYSHIHALQQLIQLDLDLQYIRGLQDPIFGWPVRFDVVREKMVKIRQSGGIKSLDYSEHQQFYIPLNSVDV